MAFAKLINPIVGGADIGWFALAFLFFVYVVVRAVIVQGGVLVILRRMHYALTHRVFQLPFSPGQLRSELLAGLQTALLDGVLIATLVKFTPVLERPGLGVFASFAVTFVWFEIWFYLSHRLLHTKALYFIHKQHHTAKVTSPMTALSFSVLERILVLAGGLGPLFVVSLWMPVSATGIALYLFVNYFLNVMAHSNVEFFPARWTQHPVGRILNAPTYHALHHARYQGHYGLFTPFMDDLFDSRFADYEGVQEKARTGNGLTSLSQRLNRP
jgi:lathosterol oxidase